MIGKVLAINTSEKKGVVKHPVEEAYFKIDHGIVGDAHASNWHRQVSLLGIESFARMELEEGIKLPMGSFAENLTTQGIELFTLPVGTKFKIGETLHELTQIGKKCHTGCAISQLVGKCVMPQEGIFTIVLEEGIVRPGDTIEVLQ